MRPPFPRGIALIDDQAQYTLAISSSQHGSGNFCRGAVADGTNNYWGYSRNSSTYYFGFDAPGGAFRPPWNNLRDDAYLQRAAFMASRPSRPTRA